MYIDSGDLIIVAITFLLAGILKGAVGSGLPTLSLAVLTIAFGLQPAMALLLVPSFVTHVWQAVTGAHTWAIVARLWLFMLTMVVAIWFGVSLASSLRMWVLMALLGVVLIAHAMTGLFGLRMPISKRIVVRLGPLAGILTGVCTGLTGAFEAPGTWYCQAVGLPRNQLVQATAILCIVSAVGLGVSLNEQRLLPPELRIVSAGAVAPAVIGIVLGNRWRRRKAAARFRRVFFVALLALGLYILIQVH